MVTYNSAKVYIASKITTSKWNVVTNLGATPTATTTIAVTSIAHAFSSLNAAVGGGSPGAAGASFLNTSNLTSGSGYVLNIPCYYDTGPDTSSFNSMSFTTSATNYIRIYTPTNTSTEANQSQRHNGKWNSSKFNMQSTFSVGNGIIGVSTAYMRVDGLQFYLTASASTPCVLNVNSASAGNVYISNNIMRVKTSKGATGTAIISSWANLANIYVYNNIIYGSSGISTYSGSAIAMLSFNSNSFYVYNNTLYNNTIGIYKSGATLVAKNNIAYNNTTDYTGAFDSSSTNNLSKDATAPAYNKYYVNATVNFVSTKSGAEDLHLSNSDSSSRGLGANLTADANLPFTTDIDGQVRPATGSVYGWDIGADQTEKPTRIDSRPNTPVPAGPAGVAMVYYSVGQNTSNHMTGSPTVSISSAGVATFSQPQTARNLGVGDVITYNSAKAYISGKITQSKWNVVTALGATPSATTSIAVTSIAHVFSSLNGAVGGATPGVKVLLGNTTDLTSATGINVILNIPCYYDTCPDTSVSYYSAISAFTTSLTNYLRIYTPTNTSTEANQSQRHNGKWNNQKFSLQTTSASGIFL